MILVHGRPSLEFLLEQSLVLKQDGDRIIRCPVDRVTLGLSAANSAADGSKPTSSAEARIECKPTHAPHRVDAARASTSAVLQTDRRLTSACEGICAPRLNAF